MVNEYIIDQSALPFLRPPDNHTSSYSLLAGFPVLNFPEASQA